MANPNEYRNTFELHADGQAVLDDLVRLFGAPPFVQGQPDTTAFNCGARAVIEHIHGQIAKADDPRQR